MARRSIRDIEKIWTNVEGVKKLSDRVIGIGPFGLGLDALLTWVPVVGTVYTVATGGWLLLQGLRVGADPATLVAANALQKHIESTHWVEANEQAARASGEHEQHLAAMRANAKARRIIYLHD